MNTNVLAAQILERALTGGVMIVTAESCTGGLLGAALTAIPGSSEVYDRGFITYSYPAKTQLLGVGSDILGQFGAVSEQVAVAMATGALHRSDAQIAISVTGVAGPGASDSKPEGLVWFGVATRDGTRAEKREFGALGRDAVRAHSVETALELILQELASGAP